MGKLHRSHPLDRGTPVARRSLVLLLALAGALVSRADTVAAQAVSTSQSLQFSALGQSMWGPGGASTVSWSRSFGTSWNRTLNVGGIIGSVNDVCFPNPFGDDWCTEVDTRTGAMLSGQTDGNIGVNLGASMTAGNVDVMYGGQATVTASSAAVTPGGTLTLSSAFSLNPLATSMQTEFASVEAYVDFEFDIFARGVARACAIGFGCTSASGTMMNVDRTIEVVALNRGGDGEVRLLGEEIPLEFSVGPVDVEAHLPSLETTASISGDNLVASGAQDLLELGMDVPQLVANAILPGLGYALSGDFGFLHYDVFGSSIGPTLGIAQNFLFDATPMVMLTFSDPVQRIIGGIAQAATTSITFRLGESIDITSDFADLQITPFYFLENTLRVTTDATARVDASISVLGLSADMPFGLDDLTLGPVFSDNWSSPSARFTVDDRAFAMQFAQFQGDALHVTATPEPGTIILMGTGLAAVAARFRRRRKEPG